jgi:asparagine synthase (glutamine-hydrolysing)
MCGFAIEIVRQGAVNRQRLAAALDALGHRGPDASGQQVSRIGDVEVGLAHARLAVLDLDPRAGQPFHIGGHTLVYNGEIYNFAALAAGMALVTTGDTEVLARLLANEGTAALQRCNGMWALGWLDEAARRFTAARDPFGKKPLFYSMAPGRIAMASTLQALLALTGAAPVALQPALDSFVRGGWLFPDADGGTTHLAGIRELKPGHALEVDLAGWSHRERRIGAIDTGDADTPPDDAELPELLADAVALRLNSDRKVGLMLSGGVDSTLILSVLAARGWLGRVVCITGDGGKSEDAAYARACAADVGARLVDLPMDYGSAGLEVFLDVCRHQEKPFPLIGNVLGLHALYGAIQREGVTVALDGAGADEIFGGYWYRYAGYAMQDAACAGDQVWMSGIRAGGMLPAAFAEDANPAPPEERLDDADAALLGPAVSRRIAAAAPPDPLTGFEGSLAAAMTRDARAGRLQEWLWQNDRTAMAASIENRSPFLDGRLTRWISQGHVAKFEVGLNKPVLRRLFSAFQPLPSAARGEKQGFRWVHGRFARHNREALLQLLAASSVARSYLGPSGGLDLLRRTPELLEGPLAQRLVVLAGLQAVGKLSDTA